MLNTKEEIDLLERMLKELKGIRKVLVRSRNEKILLQEFPDWISLPDHLRKTCSALIQLEGSATADEIAEVTGRARAVESGYLNQLVIAGYLLKPPKKGRRQYFKFAGIEK